MSSLMRHMLTYAAAAFTITGCISAPYQKPNIAVPSAWQERPQSSLVESHPMQPRATRAPWWRQFNDPALNALIEKVVDNNHDLKIAEARIDEAKALNGEALSKLFPSIDATASASRVGQQTSTGGSDTPNSAWQAGIGLNWVIDLFGGTRAEIAAADAASARSQAQYRSTTLLLVAETARTYIEMRALQQRLALITKNIKLEEETLRITRLQYEAQAVSKLDILRASAQVETTKAQIPAIEILLASSYHRLATLSGESPGSIETDLKETKPLPVFGASVLLDTPADIIASRPDIAAAEASFSEATALKNVATAELFPKISISSFFGTSGSSLFNASNPWSAGINGLLPLLNFGRIESRIDVADARKTQALHAYKQTVLKALEEVENALVAYDRETRRAELLHGAAQSNREAARIARLKYQAGDATFLDLLIAEERQLGAESDAVIAHANTAKAAIALNSALGDYPIAQQTGKKSKEKI